MALLSGTLFANRFEIDRQAGVGGMGTVYRARDHYSGDVVALKIMRNTDPAGQDAERFAREAQLLGELRHPGIVAHVAHGQTPEGQLYLAMEWLEGEDLHARLKRGPLPLGDAIALLRRVAAALSLAHQRGVIHRDLKPANIFLIGGQIDQVKILDFGIARRATRSLGVTGTGLIVGTPEYMAPEQARGQRDLGPSADVFALGCVLYECLAGQPPFVAEHLAAVLVRILFEEPLPVQKRRAGIPDAVAELVHKMLAKTVAARPSDASALGRAIDALGALPTEAGDKTALSLAVTHVPGDSFAETEQDLFCVVIAAPRGSNEGTELASTMQLADSQRELARRQSLEGALTSLGARPEWLLDGTLVVTLRSTGSALDQAALAARAALRIKSQWPEAQVALATGRGSVQGAMPIGEAAERASQLLRERQATLTESANSATAGPTSGVFIDALSARLLERYFEVMPQSDGSVLLGEPLEVTEARRLLGKSVPCLGRESELGSLEAHVRSCVDESEARAVILTAAPGVGKSRLRFEFLQRVRQGGQNVTAIEGRGEMMSAGSPYAIIGKALRRLCGVSGSEDATVQRTRMRERLSRHLAAGNRETTIEFLGEMCGISTVERPSAPFEAARQDPKLMRDQIQRAFLDWLGAECKAAGVVLLLDDLQWGDGLSVALVDEALQALAGLPLFVLALARPELSQVFPSLWQGRPVQEMRLSSLSKKACERLIHIALGPDVAPDTVARLHERSGGNALFLEELLRAMAQGEEVGSAETVLAMLQARLGRLSSEARRAVRAASIFGQTFWQGALFHVIGLEPGSQELLRGLRVLTDAELIQAQRTSQLPGEKEYSFRHALMRDAAYSLLSTEDLRVGHQRAAEYLERQVTVDPIVLADHFVAAGQGERAIPYFIAAAMMSFSRSDLPSVIARVERGLAVGPKGPALGALKTMQGLASAYLGNVDVATAKLREGLPLCEEGSVVWCLGTGNLIGFLQGAGFSDGDWQLASHYLACDPQDDAVAAYVTGTGVAGSVFSTLGYAEPAHRFLNRAEKVCARAPHIPTVQVWQLWARALDLDVSGVDLWTTLDATQAAFEGFMRLSDPRMSGFSGALLAQLLIELGEPEQAMALLRDRFAAAQRSHELVVMGWLLIVICTQLIDDPAHAAEVDQGIATLRSLSWFQPCNGGAERMYAERLLAAGQLAEAETALRKAAEINAPMPSFFTPVPRVLVELLLSQGRTAEAVEAARDGLNRVAPNTNLASSRTALRLALARALFAAGDRQSAEAALRQALDELSTRLAQAPDATQRAKYLARAPQMATARQLAKEWLGSDPFAASDKA